MCGIAGLFSRKQTEDFQADLVRRMNSLQQHRGPDDEGLFKDDHCVLGHRRLSIIDLSQDGHQPFHSDDHRYQIVYNGELYNYIELRDELKQLGWRFRTRTDTEVLLKAYEHFGISCLQKLNGMFAFVIYDTKDHRMFLARDRFGIKPLYYVLTDDTFCFASEMKAFRAFDRLRVSLNEQSLFDYLVFNRTDIHDETFFNEIKRVPKGYSGIFDTDGLKLTQWWNPKDYLRSDCEDDFEKACLKIDELLVSAVDIRMRSDVPVGSCLSGGLDSSILIGILFNRYGVKEGYPTFTASFPGHPIDETKYIDELNELYPFRNIRTIPTPDEAAANLKDFVYTNDEPTTNPSFYSQYEVMRLAKRNGVTVLLDGQGGDEGFAGYQYFHGFHLYGKFRERSVASFFAQLIKGLLRKQHRSAYQTLAFQLMPDAIRKFLLFKTVPYIEADFLHHYIDKSRIYNHFFDAANLNQSLVRHYQYKLEHLLRMEDRNSMAFSIEARVPYLDYRLVEYLLTISGDMKIQNGETKYIQKKALGHYTVPRILNRMDKIGFGTPGEEWMLGQEWRDLTLQNYEALCRTFPNVFKKEGRLGKKGFDRWKVNQLAVWRDLFLN